MCYYIQGIFQRGGVNVTELVSVFGEIYRVPAAEEPLSSDIGVFYGDKYLWLFDVGSVEKTVGEIDTRGLKIACVLSHFHPDHVGGLGGISPEKIYLGANTLKYIGRGTPVSEDIFLHDREDILIFPLPSIHAKGSLGLQIGRCAFLGDGIYPAEKNGGAVYNSGILKEQIAKLKSLSAEYFLLSHDPKFLYPKGEVISGLEKIYSRRTKNSAFISAE